MLSRLDYGNALLAGCPKRCLDRLQKVQNSAARLVLKTNKQKKIETMSHPFLKFYIGSQLLHAFNINPPSFVITSFQILCLTIFSLFIHLFDLFAHLQISLCSAYLRLALVKHLENVPFLLLHPNNGTLCRKTAATSSLRNHLKGH